MRMEEEALAPREPERPRRLQVALVGGGAGLPRLLAGLTRFAAGGQLLPPVEFAAVIAAGGLRPRPQLAPGSLLALRTADVVVLGPASLERSLLVCLRLPGVAGALRESRALRVLVAGLEAGPAAEQLRTVAGVAGDGAVDVVLVDEGQEDERREIAAQGALQLQARVREEEKDIQRHHPERTAAAVLGIAVDAVVA